MGELSRQSRSQEGFLPPDARLRQPVQLCDKKGIVFQRSQEQEALDRWCDRDSSTWKANCKEWREGLAKIDFRRHGQGRHGRVGPLEKTEKHWKRRSRSQHDHRQHGPDGCYVSGMQCSVYPKQSIGYLRIGLTDAGAPLREHGPYFIFMLSINIFSAWCYRTDAACACKPTASGLDLAYLYYPILAGVLRSKDRFQCASTSRSLLDPFQTFIHGDDLKA